MEPNRDILVDIFKMVKENNHMLHAMRRRALIGGILKFILWLLVILTPIWLYMTYVNPSVQNLMHTVDQMRQTGADAQVQFNALQESWKQFQDKLPAFMKTYIPGAQNTQSAPSTQSPQGTTTPR